MFETLAMARCENELWAATDIGYSAAKLLSGDCHLCRHHCVYVPYKFTFSGYHVIRHEKTVNGRLALFVKVSGLSLLLFPPCFVRVRRIVIISVVALLYFSVTLVDRSRVRFWSCTV